eukprot:1092761-Alexandrium_andersonii.AAC.1
MPRGPAHERATARLASRCPLRNTPTQRRAARAAPATMLHTAMLCNRTGARELARTKPQWPHAARQEPRVQKKP